MRRIVATANEMDFEIRTAAGCRYPLPRNRRDGHQQEAEPTHCRHPEQRNRRPHLPYNIGQRDHKRYC